jgi:hypothetical protein
VRKAGLAALGAALAMVAALPVASGATHVLSPGCGGSDKAAYKPAKIVIACGDGNLFVKSITWSAWSSTSAKGKGTGRQNNCKPNCAMGRFKSYPLSIKLSAARSCPHSLREFNVLTYKYTGSRPAGTRKSTTLLRPCSR